MMSVGWVTAGLAEVGRGARSVVAVVVVVVDAVDVLAVGFFVVLHFAAELEMGHHGLKPVALLKSFFFIFFNKNSFLCY